MQPDQIILPAIATVALGTALLVPLRDDKPGKRATLRGKLVPVRPDLLENISVEPLHATAGTREPDDSADVRAEIRAEEPKPRTTLRAIRERVRRFLEGQPKEAEDVEDSPEMPVVVAERSFAEQLGELLPPAPQTESNSTNDSRPNGVHSIAIQRSTPSVALGRVVPITRLPLRPADPHISWPLLRTGSDAMPTREQRHHILAHAAMQCGTNLESILVAAFRQEDADGRLLALRALRDANVDVAHEIFVEALKVGTDDERSFAVEALIAMNMPSSVTPALSDRVDAIAAQAALGLVASRDRADYFLALEPFIDRNRIHSILALLAGIVQ